MNDRKPIEQPLNEAKLAENQRNTVSTRLRSLAQHPDHHAIAHELEHAACELDGLHQLLEQQLQPREKLWSLIWAKSFRTGDFTLSSGSKSRFFFDLKPTMLDPVGSNLIGDLILDQMLTLPPVSLIGGPAVGAVPIISVVCAKSRDRLPIQGFYVRKAAKDHGTAQLIDGADVAGMDVVLVEDVTTTGDSLLRAAMAVRDAGGRIAYAMTVVDRLEGAEDNLLRAGIRLHSLLRRDDFAS